MISESAIFGRGERGLNIIADVCLPGPHPTLLPPQSCSWWCCARPSHCNPAQSRFGNCTCRLADDRTYLETSTRIHQKTEDVAGADQQRLMDSMFSPERSGINDHGLSLLGNDDGQLIGHTEVCHQMTCFSPRSQAPCLDRFGSLRLGQIKLVSYARIRSWVLMVWGFGHDGRKISWVCFLLSCLILRVHISALRCVSLLSTALPRGHKATGKKAVEAEERKFSHVTANLI